MQKTTLIFAIFLAVILLWAGCKNETTGTLYGVVTDSRTGEPVTEANVELSSVGLQTLTGSDGWYQFSEVKSGEYKIVVTKSGYDSSEKSGILVEEGPVRCDLQLESIPSFEYGGHSYMVAPNADDVMTLADANSYCQGLTQYGFSDWRLPTKAELEQMYINKDPIGDFLNKVYWSSTYSSTQNAVDLYYVIHFLNGNVMEANPGSKLRVRPIRLDH